MCRATPRISAVRRRVRTSPGVGARLHRVGGAAPGREASAAARPRRVSVPSQGQRRQDLRGELSVSDVRSCVMGEPPGFRSNVGSRRSSSRRSFASTRRWRANRRTRVWTTRSAFFRACWDSPLFSPIRARRRMSGSSTQSMMKSVRSTRPISRSAAARSCWRGYDANLRSNWLGAMAHATMVAALRSTFGRFEAISEFRTFQKLEKGLR